MTTSTVNQKPLFQHSCTCCVFLGTTEVSPERAGKGAPAYADWYGCLQNSGIKTVIARFGNEGPDYTSGWPSGSLYARQTDPFESLFHQKAIEFCIVLASRSAKERSEKLKADHHALRERFARDAWTLQSAAVAALNEEMEKLGIEPQNCRVHRAPDPAQSPWINASIYNPEDGPHDLFVRDLI